MPTDPRADRVRDIDPRSDASDVLEDDDPVRAPRDGRPGRDRDRFARAQGAGEFSLSEHLADDAQPDRARLASGARVDAPERIAIPRRSGEGRDVARGGECVRRDPAEGRGDRDTFDPADRVSCGQQSSLGFLHREQAAESMHLHATLPLPFSLDPSSRGPRPCF